MSYFGRLDPTIENGYIQIPIKEVTVLYSIDREFGPIDASINNVKIEADIPKKIKKELESKLTWTLIDHEVNFNDPDWEKDVERILNEEYGIDSDCIRFSSE